MDALEQVVANKSKAKQLIQQLDRLKSDRKNIESTWQDVSKYVCPRKAYVTREKVQGEKLDSDVYDSTAVTANNVLAAGLHSYLTNPSQRWFVLRLRNSDNVSKEIRDWVYAVENRIYDVLNITNFAHEIHESYLDFGPFGMLALCIESDPKTHVRFHSRPPKEIYIEEDNTGRVGVVYRLFSLTVRQAYEEWGDAAGKEVVDKFKQGLYLDRIDILHYIGPRYDYDPAKKDVTNMPFESCYVLVKTEEIIEQGGYRSMPILTPRYTKSSGEVYGIGPGQMVYPEVSMVNRMVLTMIRSAEKMCDPPVILPHKDFLQPMKYYPGAINYKTGGSPMDKIEFLMSHGNIPINMEIVQQTREVIKSAFNVNLFLLLEEQKRAGNMTATEVTQRNSEKLLILAPVLGRLISELLNPLIQRVIEILAEADQLPKPPQSYIDLVANDPEAAAYKIVYTSPLAKSQRMEDLKSITTLMTIVGESAQFKPEILDNIDIDQVFGISVDILNAPTAIMLDPKKVKAIREARAQQMQAQQQLQAANMMAQTAMQGASAGKTAKEAQIVGEPTA